MYEQFLQHLTTTAHQDRNFVEWHGGIKHYGFWAIIIQNRPWENLFNAASDHIQGLTLKGYRRQPHITISSSGLLDPKHFSKEQFEQQYEALIQADIAAFTLTANSLNSFAGSPYISIDDQQGGLSAIRRVLHSIIEEDSPATEYTPHITLGLYDEAFNCPLVVECLERFEPRSVADLYVDKIAFCSYETDSIQGPLVVIDSVRLTPNHGMQTGQ
ncbi:hypothetical protein SIN8267_00465 [Sinobacterium norvegicum]|uniref:2'-5' RNA ligase n=1 Tax=Sinobacterium norvegicum TaxID=1641715 RepID=A0ABM9AB04_9GAMM|nr:2'-5' RNA ligase family protein [Sinobacterium norvegicum]CAH0990373.1 hypothetical protein SIN8267_00465 [Sinobacterium norvegicum]